MSGFVILILVLLLVLMGVPIAFGIGIACALFLIWQGVDLAAITQVAVNGVNSFPLLAIPLFIFTGEIMNTGGVTQRLVRFASAWVGHLMGGLGHVGVVANMVMAGLSGSAVADASALTTVLYPAMTRKGYRSDFSAALLAAAATIGPVIPPSIPMVIYALTVSASVAGLFLGGVIPGILIGVSLMVYCAVVARKHGYEPEGRFSLREALTATVEAIPALLMPMILIGGVLAGIFTPTESAAVAGVYGILVGTFVYRELTLQKFWRVASLTASRTAVVTVIIAFAGVLSYVMAMEQLPAMVAEWLSRHATSPAMFLLLANLFLLIVGFFLDSTPAILITAPILVPIAASFGISPIHFGVVMTVNLMIGLLTPPVGALLYVVSDATGLSIEELVRALLPLFIPLLIVLFLVTYMPWTTVALPGLFGFGR